MAKSYVCNGCNKGCSRDVTHKCKKTCCDFMSVPPCAFSEVRIPCESCNRNFRSQTCFGNHKKNKVKEKTVREQKRNCCTCGSLFTEKKNHEYFKPSCANCRRNVEIGHLCYISPLKHEVPRSDNVLFVFYDFETTQDTKLTESATLHIPNVVCVQQFCAHCEMSAE